MSKQTFEELLNRFGISETIVVQKVTIDSSKQELNLILSCGVYPDLDGVAELEKTILSNLPILKAVRIGWVFSWNDEGLKTWLKKYWHEILLPELNRRAPLCAPILSGAEPVQLWGESGVEIDLVVSDATELEALQNRKCDRLIQQLLNEHFGKPIRLMLRASEEANFCQESYINEKDAETDVLVKKAMDEAKSAPKANRSESASKPASGTPAKGSFEGGFSKGNFGDGFKKREKVDPNDPRIIFRRLIKSNPVPIRTVEEEEAVVCIEGEVFDKELRELRGGKTLISFAVSDRTNSISCKLFAEADEVAKFEAVQKGSWYRFEGRVKFDTYERELSIQVLAINVGEAPFVEKRVDKSEMKRIELHAHTSMSAMDALPTAKALVKRAAQWGHTAIAITDHGVLQAFPEAMDAGKANDVKILYGMEGYVVNDQGTLVQNSKGQRFDSGTFVVFDLETTGLSFQEDRITEIGAVKIENGQITDRFSSFVNPERPIPAKITELTGITDAMVQEAPTIETVLPQFMSFVGEAVLVAHNAAFDISFIRYNCRLQDIPFNPTVADTLTMSRLLLRELKRHRLNVVAKHLGVELENHHRAVHDAEATALIFLKLVEKLAEKAVEDLDHLNRYGAQQFDVTREESYHILILVQNLVGLKNLYEMVSSSHIETFYKKPRVLKSMLEAKREGLIYGTACEAGELFQGLLSNQNDEKIREIVEFYDFLEIQPLGNNKFLIDKGLARDEEALRDLNRTIVRLGEQYGKPVAATGDLHFIDPEDEVYRRILMAGQGFGDAENQPPLYFKTTEEMLDEFSYLGSEKAREVVIEVPNQIADRIESIKPIPDGTYPPIIEGSDTELREMCFAKARRIYGENLPEILEKRLERELNSIISNGYAVMYIIAQKLVTKSISDGYMVGSRGSVGSSLAATMSDITEVNPLPPHYVCPNESCKHSEFILDGSIGSGADLPDRECPKCGTQYRKDGYDIPFETFLGFEGDKEPDIDLNFAGEYQPRAHAYTEELFGKGYVYRAGTIGTIADKTAFGFVKKYFEEREKKVHPKEIMRLAMGCTGVKRTSGQHPGGIMVVPSYKDIHDFCPIQYPANDGSSGIITTHFDYHSISGRILKLDILGHDGPTIIRMLEDLTGVNAMEIPLDDPTTVSIFTTIDALKVKDSAYPLKIGSLGIPEFGTKFVREMLKDTQPTTFAELVRIAGLSHGTDVWLNNAQEFVRAGEAELKDVISTRDDIMNYLIYAGIPHKTSFTIMENVRKGKGLKEEQEALMRENNVPEWYIESCKRIKYMFPKAHAVAYVMMSFRIAWFKVYYPLAFYATFFTIKCDDFDAELMCLGPAVVVKRMRELDEIQKPTQKEKDQYTLLEVVQEFYARGYEFHRVDLYISDGERFMPEEGKLRPPLRALQGVGDNAARSIAENRGTEFLSKDDLRKRAKVTKTVIEVLDQHGCLAGMPDDDQLTLFQFA